MVGGVSQASKPFQIGSAHGAFPIHVGTKKRRTVGLQLNHNVFSAKFQRAPPTLSPYVTFSAIQSDHNPGRVESLYQLLEKRQIYFSIAERRAADDDLFRLP